LIDKARISQVLDNLITNAVKYSPAAGTIRVEGRVLHDEIEISVHDQGIGMDREVVERIFEKFYRANTSPTAVGGLGLGLCVAKGIVEAHGGRIWVESEPQKGTKAIFTLPVVPVETAAARP
jgi:signal transduction histidine kinase